MQISDLNLSYLKFFIDTVELGSFTKAAEKNFVSRPAISQGISRLEIWYGKQLMHHKKRELKLTSDGELFFRIAKEAHDQFVKQMTMGKPSNNKLHIGCSASLATLVLGPYLKRTNTPEDLVVKVGNTKQLLRNLDDGEVNISIYIDTDVNTGFPSRDLYKGNFSLYSTSGKLESTTMVTEPRPEVIELQRWIHRKKMNTTLVTIESWSLAKSLAEIGHCNCLIPDFLKDKNLKLLKTSGYNSEYRIRLSHRPYELLSSQEVDFCERIKI